MDIKDRRELVLLIGISVMVGGSGFNLGVVFQDHFGKSPCSCEDSKDDHRSDSVEGPYPDGRIQTGSQRVDSFLTADDQRGVICLNGPEHDRTGSHEANKSDHASERSTEEERLQRVSYLQAQARPLHADPDKQHQQRNGCGDQLGNPVHMSVSGTLSGSHPQCYRQTGTTADQADFSACTRSTRLASTPLRVVTAGIRLGGARLP